MRKNIFFSVGEPSGDHHAADLIASLSKSDPELRFRGFGGPAMREAGLTLDLELTGHAVVGLLEVLPKLREFFRFVDQAEAVFAAGEVDAVVLVDFPGFNWHIAKRAKKYGIPVFYYCPPQLWAWAAWRIRKMKATVDHVLAVLPIEKTFFEGHGIPTTFVGHPFFDAVASKPLAEDHLGQLRDKSSGQHTVAVLPGSRTHEVHRNWPLMLAAIRRLAQKHPETRFAVAAYRQKHRLYCEDSLTLTDTALPIDFYEGATSEVIEHSNCAMMVSGSVSLEMMARETPAAVIYRVGRFLYAFGKCVIKVDSMTLPNLMEDPEADSRADSRAERPFPEQVSVGNPARSIEFLVRSVGRMIGEPAYLDSKREQLRRLKRRYATPGASQRAADCLRELLEEDQQDGHSPAETRAA